MRAREHAPDGGWLWVPRSVRSIGYAAYDFGFEMAIAIPLEFDGLILIDRSTPSRPLRRSR